MGPGLLFTSASTHQTLADEVALAGPIRTERSEAVGTQLGISDRAAFLFHPGCAKAAVGAYEMIVLLTLADVLRRRFAPFGVVMRAGWDRGCLY